jgi:hypothetical protein
MSNLESAFDKGKQVGIDHIGMSGEHAVGITLVKFQGSVFEQFDGFERRIGDRHDLVVVAMHDQSRHNDRLQMERDELIGAPAAGASLRGFGAVESSHFAATKNRPRLARPQAGPPPLQT